MRHMASTLLMHVEEGFWSGDPKAVGILNNLITAPTVSIERKGIDLDQMPSVLRLFMSSNEGWVVPATADERRYAVFESAPSRLRGMNTSNPSITSGTTAASGPCCTICKPTT